MCLRFVVLLALALSHLEPTDALDFGWWAGYVIDNPETVGLPGYVRLLSMKKSGLLTKLLHLIFGNKLENMFQELLKTAVERMPNEAVIEDVRSDNTEKMTFLNGKILGLKSIRMTPGTEVGIIWSTMGIPVAVVSVQFTDLIIEGEVKTSMKLKEIDGNAEIKVLEQNNFVLKFHLYPGAVSNCWLKLYDVMCSDMESLQWTVRRHTDNTVDNLAGMAMQSYFSTTDNHVEDHIKTTIDNIIYHEVPLASKGICHNTKKWLKLSKYQRNDKKEVVDTDDALFDYKNVEIK